MGAAPSSIPSPGSEYTVTLLADDFTGSAGSPPSSANWILQTGTQYPGGPPQWGTWEVETYTSSSSNVALDGNGHLLITPQLNNGQWTSARVESHSDSFAAPAGGKMKVQASISMPAVTCDNGIGYWPAFWMLGNEMRANYSSWPAPGEIDIMENINGQGGITQVLHCDIDPNGPCNEPDGLGHKQSCSSGRCPGSFHTYAIVIDRSVSPETLTWYLDGTSTNSITQTQLGSSVWAETIDHGFYLIMNVAMGGSYPNAVYGSTTPTQSTQPGQNMSIEYVAVWTT